MDVVAFVNLRIGDIGRFVIGEVASESSFRICGARHVLGASRRVREVSCCRDGSWLCSHPLSAGRDFPSRARLTGRYPAARLRARVGARIGVAPPRPTGGDPESGPVAPAPRRSPGVGGCHVPVYMLAGLGAQPSVTREPLLRRIAQAWFDGQRGAYRSSRG